jgi:hypothetical protein
MCLWVGMNIAECSIADLQKIELIEPELD